MVEITLEVFEDGTPAGNVTLSGDAELRVGRTHTCDVVLKSDTVSRLHCLIRLDGQEASLHNLSSSQGSRVNGRRVDKARLQDGDRIQIGTYELVLRWPQEPPPEPRSGESDIPMPPTPRPRPPTPDPDPPTPDPDPPTPDPDPPTPSPEPRAPTRQPLRHRPGLEHSSSRESSGHTPTLAPRRIMHGQIACMATAVGMFLGGAALIATAHGSGGVTTRLAEALVKQLLPKDVSNSALGSTELLYMASSLHVLTAAFLVALAWLGQDRAATLALRIAATVVISWGVTTAGLLAWSGEVELTLLVVAIYGIPSGVLASIVLPNNQPDEGT